MRSLLSWYDRYGRDLPWRKTRDPYRVLVSEIMLQQTQVPRVVLFYGKWLKRFPSWTALAGAAGADVIRAWSGLGYNRRALMLRDIARHVAGHGVPKTEDAWRALKGIGPYTAAAVALFSQRARAFPVDSVIRRVGGRFLLGKPFPQTKDDARIARHAVRIMNARRYWDVPQALFDLGSALCKKTPACAACPLREDCPAAPKFLSGRTKTPKAMIKKANESKHRNKPHPDRIYRGRILKLAHHGVAISSLGANIDPSFNRERDGAWLLRMLDRMEKDRMIKKNKNRVFLPDAE